MATNRTYIDIDLDFTPHPTSADISQKYDEDAVKRSIRNLILTGKYERPFQPELNSRIAKLLFDLFDPLTAMRIRSNIIDIIEQYEPRAKILDVTVEAAIDSNYFGATVTFRMVNSSKVATLNVVLERSR